MEKANAVGETRSLTCDRCEHGVCGPDAPATFYVHFHSGEIVPVSDVIGLEVTETFVVLQRQTMASLSYSRSSIFYACCNKDMSPPQC